MKWNREPSEEDLKQSLKWFDEEAERLGFKKPFDDLIVVRQIWTEVHKNHPGAAVLK